MTARKTRCERHVIGSHVRSNEFRVMLFDGMTQHFLFGALFGDSLHKRGAAARRVQQTIPLEDVIPVQEVGPHLQFVQTLEGIDGWY